jgi:FMN phosphatase YigB (HAD superfamily)
LAIVTNCSERLGGKAVASVGVAFDVVVIAERAGAYKPDPRPYRLALDELGVAPERALFVAGSVFDVNGARALGMDVYWHNRAGLPRPDHAPALIAEHPSLEPLVDIISGQID